MHTINTYYHDLQALENFVQENSALFFANNNPILVQVFSGVCDKDFLLTVTKQIRQLLPAAQVIGSTTAGEIMDGVISGQKTVLSFSLFQEIKLETVFLEKGELTDYELGRVVAESVSPRTKVMIMFATGLSIKAYELLEGIHSVAPELLVAGGSAADNFEIKETMVFCNDALTRQGVVGITLESECLQVRNYWHLGWRRIGKEMTVTRADRNRLYSIEELPARQVYQKYLGVDKKDSFKSAWEFPFMVFRDGVEMARIASFSYEDDSLHFFGDIVEGEKVSLSFGNIGTVLETNSELHRRINRNPAESIFVYSCGIRRSFLKEYAEFETISLQNIAPTSGFFTYGEYYHTPQSNLLLNATMTTLVLAEDSEQLEETNTDSWTGLDDLASSLGTENLRTLKSLTHLVNVVTSELKQRSDELEKANDRLSYISLHDPLTGLYNRACFEQEMARLQNLGIQVGVIICDVDCLKMVNDIYGHDVGDRLLNDTAAVISKFLRAGDIAARIGGDEFAILLPNINQAEMELICDRIQKLAEQQSFLVPGSVLSISLGSALYGNGATSLEHALKLADSSMYSNKLSKNNHNSQGIMNNLVAVLQERDLTYSSHVEHLIKIMTMLGNKVGLSSNEISKLALLARFHDIGQAGIPLDLVIKTQNLRSEVQKHCELGYRIAKSLPELNPIADWIIKHHEWWDGTGYPLGLKAEDIPLECRIFAIAEAYDALTRSRPYRAALSARDALHELRQGAGKQFDPHLVELFSSTLQEHVG